MATCAAPPQAPPPPRPEQCAPRPLGSRFWALAEDSSNDECVSLSPPPSASPAHRPSEFMVGDFICTALLSPVASRSCRGRRQAFAPGGRVLSRGASRPVPARRPPSPSSSAPARARVLGGLGSAVDSPEWLSHKMFPRLVEPVLAPSAPCAGSPAAAECLPEPDPDPDPIASAAPAPLPTCPSGVGGSQRSALVGAVPTPIVPLAPRPSGAGVPKPKSGP
jgi:hypothetical protein